MPDAEVLHFEIEVKLMAPKDWMPTPEQMQSLTLIMAVAGQQYIASLLEADTFGVDLNSSKH